MSRSTCTDHAACCDRHFHGLGAFDLHRKSGVCTPPEDVLVKDRPALQVWTTDGYCRLGKGGVVSEHVTIWQKVMTELQREALQKLNIKESGRLLVEQA